VDERTVRTGAVKENN